jgi:hypothetical protein
MRESEGHSTESDDLAVNLTCDAGNLPKRVAVHLHHWKFGVLVFAERGKIHDT